MDEIEVAREFWKDHGARISMGKPLVDPVVHGFTIGRKYKLEDLEIVRLGLERLIRSSEVDSDTQARAHKIIHALKEAE